MGFLGSLIGGLGSGLSGMLGGGTPPLQGMAGHMPTPQPQSNGLLASLFSGQGGVPGSLRPSNVGMPGYQADTANFLNGQAAPGGAGIGGNAPHMPPPFPTTTPIDSSGTPIMANLLSDTMPSGKAPSLKDVAQGAAYKIGSFPKVDSIKSMIGDQVQRSGSSVSPGYFDRMAQIESGYNPTAVSPTGAKGLFQFTTGTWKDFGSGNPLDPVNNTKAAIDLTNANNDVLQQSLGRPPTNGELYMAHNIGAVGAKRLLGADPNMPVTQALIGSNPAFNPKFLQGPNGSTIKVQQAIQNYNNAFEAQ